jgi:tRNA G18 (ribose-2'-O)-methylase SpoU
VGDADGRHGVEAAHLELLGCFANPDALRERGLFAAEGRLVVERVIGAGRCDVALLVVTPSARVAMATSLVRLPAGVPVLELPPDELQRLVGYPLDRGCLALVRRPGARALASIVDAALTEPRGVWLALEHVGNPDNVGGLFRSGAAFGVAGIVLVGGCADPLYRKAIRTSLGNTLSVPFAQAASPDEALAAFGGHGVACVALVAHGGIALHAWRPPAARVALWVGHEGQGLSDGAIAGCAHRVSVAMPGAIDSLNVTTAASIALHYVVTR